MLLCKVAICNHTKEYEFRPEQTTQGCDIWPISERRQEHDNESETTQQCNHRWARACGLVGWLALCILKRSFGDGRGIEYPVAPFSMEPAEAARNLQNNVFWVA